MTQASGRADQNKTSFQISPKVLNSVSSIIQSLKINGIFSSIQMKSAGFEYTGVSDTACCRQCGLEISNWTSDMKPFSVHSKRSPECPFIQSISSNILSIFGASTYSSLAATAAQDLSLTTSQENPNKRHKVESSDSESTLNSLFETDSLQQVRIRTFSHWPQRNIPSSAQMIEAGFFNCNVGDRVICIYCNLICQQWTPHTDNPCEVHKTLSPNCVFVTTKLMRPASSSIIIVNDDTMGAVIGSRSPTGNSLAPIRSNDIVFAAPCNPAYAEERRRHASYTAWPAENLPPVDDLVRAGFFYTGTKSTVACFYCNGSLQNWGANDNPMIEHARWFPHCAYARQLCGDDLYRKIQELKRAQQELRSSSGHDSESDTSNQPLGIINEATFSELVAARLDLPISRQLLAKGFSLSIITRCWEDQLRTKHDDFVPDCDLYIACTILQKQINMTNDGKQNIFLRRISVERIRMQNELHNQKLQLVKGSAYKNTPPVLTDLPRNKKVHHRETSLPLAENIQVMTQRSINPKTMQKAQLNHDATKENHALTKNECSNSCVLCVTEGRQVIFSSCGHRVKCASCGELCKTCFECENRMVASTRISND